MLANAGVPMLFVQMPFLLMALPLVIAIEAVLCRHWLNVPWKRAWVVTTIANAISTLAGFPILWIALVIIQLLAGGGGEPGLAEPWYSIYSVTVQAAWLLPDGKRLYWMVPTAGIVLLIPAFFVTVLIEGIVYRKAFGEACPHGKVTRATWGMHFITYGLLFIAAVALLLSSIRHHRRASDAETETSQVGRS